MIFTPQKGFQQQFASTPADIAIGGSGAGVGKTWVLLYESMRYINAAKGFGSVIFRRTTPQIRAEGGLWDASKELFYHAGGQPTERNLTWKFPNGNKIAFSHLQYEKDVLNWQGTELPFIGFDELTHFTEYQFNYMISRNRSKCGCKPYIRATCNPDPESWVVDYVDWYLGEDGFPIRDRVGKLRYFTNISGDLIWGDNPDDVVYKALTDPLFREQVRSMKKIGVSPRTLIKSFTFIDGNIYDNKQLISKNPAYVGNLMALSEIEQNMLLRGNWKVNLDGLNLYNFKSVDEIFHNYNLNTSVQKFITCDAARFGSDFCVIMVWQGWEAIYFVIMEKSDSMDIRNEIELLRQRFGINRMNVLVDQDGVGGGTVKAGGYRGFHGGAPAIKTIETGLKAENYFNLKTQCKYRIANENINVGNIRISVADGNVKHIDRAGNVTYSNTFKCKGKVTTIQKLIIEDLRSVRREPRDDDGKLRTNSKELQKEKLGRSPDFGDCIEMRKLFDIIGMNISITIN